ncbi:uncharacterized protein LOC113794756 [Dermatophagoides pteronyssinus]|uniref:uncharacterized protein LOC113794756 n=1 Tax=Dermatophagoides pteronyssinus TaxID=6956 RepID=UPI003F67FCD2
MNYSKDILTATTTPRLRQLQSSSTSTISSSSVSNNQHYHQNNKHNNSNVSNNFNNILANSHQLKNGYNNNNNNLADIVQQLTFISSPLPSTHQTSKDPIIEQTTTNIMMSTNSDGNMVKGGSGGGGGIITNNISDNNNRKTNSNKLSDKQVKIGEIEPLLSQATTTSSSNSTSATISPIHETYNAANKTTVIIHDNSNNNNHHYHQNDGQSSSSSSSSSSSVHLTMDHGLSPHHRNNNNNNNGLIHHQHNHHHHNIHNENDLLNSINEEESSSLLMSTPDNNYNHHLHSHYTVIRTQSLKNIILLNLLSMVFVSLNMTLNLLVISVIHERIPMQEPHLPDIAFDILPDHRHFLDISEYVIVIQTVCIGLLLFFHKHRSTILRRICIILGIIYFFRALCLASTQLPLASKNYSCSPQLKNSSQYENITSLQFIEIIVSRVFYMSLGMGLSINGHHTFCGDYIFSGHTVMLVLSYLIQQEYLLPSRRRTLAWRCVDIIQIVMTVTSIICILIARGHYFIDIIIAYYVTTRIFWIYHTLCSFSAINLKSTSNHLNRVWWWPIFVYLENIRVIPNHHSQQLSNHYSHSKHHHHHHLKNDDYYRVNQVQRIFEWPLPWPKRFAHRKHHHRSHQFTA